MAMVISDRAKAVIIGVVCLVLLGGVLVAASTKGWFVAQRYHGERTAARIQVIREIWWVRVPAARIRMTLFKLKHRYGCAGENQ